MLFITPYATSLIESTMPTSYPFTQVDAFAETPLKGNPCAVVFDADVHRRTGALDALSRSGEGEVVGPRDVIETVKVGGRTLTVLRGELNLS